MKATIFFGLLCLLGGSVWSQQSGYYPADDARLAYMGRIDFKNPKLPRFWNPATAVFIRFKGTWCEAIVNDQELWGKNHNYLSVQIDGQLPHRIQTSAAHNTLRLADSLTPGVHTLVLAKSTEANIGYIELEGFRCDSLLQASELPVRKIECYGNSITCGASADLSGIPCGKGVWHDQHNAFESYGRITASNLNAQWMLSSVSGIGLMHSCCNLPVLMPQVYNKIEMRGDSIPWDFSKYQPDLVTICLGQNDGIQDESRFINNYIIFLRKIRAAYPKSRLLLLTSPMADEPLRNFLRTALQKVVQECSQAGDSFISYYVFEKSFNGGCDYHPSVAEHYEIARLLTAEIRRLMNWK